MKWIEFRMLDFLVKTFKTFLVTRLLMLMFYWLLAVKLHVMHDLGLNTKCIQLKNLSVKKLGISYFELEINVSKIYKYL